MRPKLNLLCSTALRAFQILFAIVVLGLSATLIKNHGIRDPMYPYPELYNTGLPMILPLATAIGVLSLLAAVFNLIIAWTDLLREHVEMLVDFIVAVANVVGGTVGLTSNSMIYFLQLILVKIILLRIRGKDCNNTEGTNLFGTGDYPYKGSLASIDILNGGCGAREDAPDTWLCVNVNNDHLHNHLNIRCRQSGTDSVFMFMTVAIVFGTIALTYQRMKKNL
jgi:hypothetical protein